MSLQIQMDPSHDGKLQGGEKFRKYQFLQRILQFVFSVSVFSFFLWYSFGFSILPHDESFHAFFSTFLFSIFSHTLERKYMFLICNAILAFVAKTSLTSSPSSVSACDDIDDECLQTSNLLETKAILVSDEALSLTAEEQEADQEKKQEHYEEEEASEAAEEQEAGENIELEASVAKEDEEEVGPRGSEVMVLTPDDEVDTTMAENEEISNADELTRKIEEFIRKMKEEIRIEAQRQLIAV